MKVNLLTCFLFATLFVFAKEEREVIKEIDSINTAAASFYDGGKIIKSYQEFFRARTLSDSIQDRYGYAVANYNLGNIYSLIKNYRSAEESYFLAIKALKKGGDDNLMASSYFKLGEIYRENKAFKKSIRYFEEALRYASSNEQQIEPQKITDKKLIYNIRLNLSDLYIESNNFDQALMGLIKINDFLKSQNNETSIFKANFYLVYGNYYAKKGLYNNANKAYNKAIVLLEGKKSANHLAILSKLYLQKSISLAKSGKSKAAYLALLDHNANKASYLNLKRQQEQAITKAKLQIEVGENRASIADSESLEQLEMTNKIKEVNGFILVTFIMLLVSILIILKGYVSKRKLTRILKVKIQELEKAKDKALQSSKLKTEFISNVSHELRTPLYGVVGITSLLLDNSNLNKRDRKYLKSLKYSGDYLLNLINDILQMGKMEFNKVELQNVSVSLKCMLEDIVHSFEYRLVETNNQIKLSIDDRMPEYIQCDNVRLSQILINLIGNSIKFTTNGVIHLRARLISLNDTNVGVRFEIEDNGIGIPKDKYDAIFDNFSQLEGSNVNYQGTGLGLSITKNLIELFGSKINLKSKEGVGTTFSFDIEFEIDSNHNSGSSDDNSDGVTDVPKKKYQILIAEDNKINQVVTKNLLEKQGYVCSIVKNGKEAFEAVSRKQYDLVLMDINMPIMDGNEATEAIREFNKTIPIVALTAADIDEIKEHYQSIGYNDVVIKPFNNQEFFQVVSTQIKLGKRGNLEVIMAS